MMKKLSALNHPAFGIVLLLFFAFFYCLPALRAPFWVGNDGWSNLLPVIHYRDSILNDGVFPLYTDLWYGGRAQWQNPLWNFPYLPATIFYLTLPLDWATRVIYFGHLLFILLTARSLASRFLEAEFEKVAAALLLASPVLPAFTAGQSEKIFAWGWVLLGLYFLLNKKGLWAGLCLAVVPIAGSNYHAFYAGILFFAIALSDRKLIPPLILGALPGLIHLPTVLHLAGVSRANAAQSIQEIHISFAGILSSLSIGLAPPMGWETWALVGLPLVYLFFKKIVLSVKDRRRLTPLEVALIFSLIVFFLLVTSLAYRGHHLLDSFRVPARAIVFVALVVILFTISCGKFKAGGLLILSAVQVAMMSFMIQPYGALFSPYDLQAQRLAEVLKADGARSVWVSMRELNDMYIQVALNRNGLSLPNVYYGDMGQEVKIEGNFCGYSFDHLLVWEPVSGTSVPLKADMEWSETEGVIPLSALEKVGAVAVHQVEYQIYRVVCERHQ